MKHALLFLTVMLLVGAAGASAAQLTGTVIDDTGQPIPGVSVITNVTGKGAVTNHDGRFTLELTDQMTRVTFSSVGFQSRQFKIEDVPPTVKLSPAYYRGTDIVVTADRAQSGVTPVAFNDVSSDDIKRDYTVGEFPLLLETTPNLYSYSDAGTPLGYSYMKIRGFDDKRISTYINGVPLNDPEDQATYFVDLPDFAANVTDIQVQRGVGNSLYGDASFGGSVNIVTNPFQQQRRTLVTSGYGAYTADGGSSSGIYKQSVEYASGMIDGQWLFSGRFSKQKTGGYRYNSWYDGWSYYFSVARLDPKMTTQLHLYGGPMHMHLAYWGISGDVMAANRQYNPLTYDNETDNFNQPHYQLENTYHFNDRVTLTNTLYYIHGKGYYEQLKPDANFAEYDLTAYSDSASGDLVRQQWVSKDQTGWNPRLDIEHSRGRHSIGGSFYYFSSQHWGQVVWAQDIARTLDPRHRYYEYFGKKWVGSFYAQEYYRLTNSLSTQLTAQVRYQRYKFDQTKMGAFNGYDYDVDWMFFSPRVGLNYAIDEHTHLYTNFAVSSRTPTDASIYDANDPTILPSLQIESIDTTTIPGDTIYTFGDPTAASERVYNFELGGQYRNQTYAFGVNLFWMDFRDEILPYGGINENTGLPVTVNADRSVHSGIELTASILPTRTLRVSGNLALNRNRVKDYTAQLDGYAVDFANQTIPGFPDYIANIIADYHDGPIRLTWRGRSVGKQYMELENIDSLAIGDYFVSSASVSYTLTNVLNAGNLILSARVDNIFNKKYASSGYGGNYAFEDSGNVVVGGWAEYYPAAERSYYLQLAMELF